MSVLAAHDPAREDTLCSARITAPAHQQLNRSGRPVDHRDNVYRARHTQASCGEYRNAMPMATRRCRCCTASGRRAGKHFLASQSAVEAPAGSAQPVLALKVKLVTARIFSTPIRHVASAVHFDRLRAPSPFDDNQRWAGKRTAAPSDHLGQRSCHAARMVVFCSARHDGSRRFLLGHAGTAPSQNA